MVKAGYKLSGNGSTNSSCKTIGVIYSVIVNYNILSNIDVLFDSKVPEFYETEFYETFNSEQEIYVAIE